MLVERGINCADLAAAHEFGSGPLNARRGTPIRWRSEASGHAGDVPDRSKMTITGH